MADLVVVVTCYHSRFRWFRSDPEIWVLDKDKWARDYIDSGYELPEPKEGLPFRYMADSSEAITTFLEFVDRFQVDKYELTNQLLLRLDDANSTWDVQDLFPVALIDFDRRHLCAFYAEGLPLERYVPTGWTSEFEDFMLLYDESQFPSSEKFWIVDERDLLAELNQRPNRNNMR